MPYAVGSLVRARSREWVVLPRVAGRFSDAAASGGTEDAIAGICTSLDIPQRTIERWLKKLKEQGEIVFSGPRKSGGYLVSR